MVEITRQNVDLNPTMRFTDPEGRLTGEAFRFMSLLRRIVQTVNVVDGEITTDMLADLAVDATKLDDGAVVVGKLAAGAIYVSTLFADEVVITSAVAQNAITELVAGVQVGVAGPNGYDILSLDVPVTGTNNTGVLLIFTAVTSRPTPDPGNAGDWRVILKRNGVQIAITPPIFYDDNFAYPLAVSFVDPTPGTDPTYTLTSQLDSGLGNFEISGGVLYNSLLKR